MSTKINIDTDFYDHPKIRQLRIYCGDESPIWLIRLWCYAAKYYPKDGTFLKMERQAIEKISGWTGIDGNFIGALERLNLIEKYENNYKIHDWNDHAGFIWNYHTAGKEGAKRRWKSNRSKNSTPNGTPIGTPNAIELNGIELNKDLKTIASKDASSFKEPPKPKENLREVFWAETIAHLKRTWESKKPGAVFVFGGKEASLLRPQVRAYMAWGVMALWDVYLTTDSDWYRQQGYSVSAFCPAINSLVDNPLWKGLAAKYQKKLEIPIPELNNILKRL